MSNWLDELVVGIRVNAQGVKIGVDDAKGYLSLYQKQIQSLQKEIKLKFDRSGIKDIENAIVDLNKRKQELETEIKFKTNISAINNLKSQISNIDLQIKDIKLNVDDEQAKQKLKELENIKLSLQKEINSKIKVDSAINDKRVLLAEDWARYIRTFITDGIRNGGTCLQVTNTRSTSTDTMVISIDGGIANIQGYIFISEKDSKGKYIELELEESHNQYDRIDRVVLRLDRNVQKRKIEPIILRGTASSNPIPPALTRNSVVYELSLAKILVKANTLIIKQEDITDERFNDDVCGLINSILGLDSSEWQRMFDEFMASVRQSNDDELNRIKEELEKIFNNQMTEIENWYNSVKIDITKLQSFDFDNLAELKGATKKTDFLQNGDVDEKIFITASNTKVADRLTKFLSNGDIQVNTKVYERNGVDVMKQVTVLTKFNNDGSISEVIS